MKAKVVNNNNVVQVEPDTFEIPPAEANSWYTVIENPWRAIWASLPPDDPRSTEERLSAVYLDNWNYQVEPTGLTFAYKYVPGYANGQAMYVNSEEPLSGNAVYEVIPAAPIINHRLTDLAAYRWEKEIGGINFNGYKLHTDRDSQAMMTAARLKTLVDPAIIIDWKTAEGFISLGAPMIEAMTDAVAYHVEYCFSKEREHAETMKNFIDAYDLMKYDFTTGWNTAWVENATII